MTRPSTKKATAGFVHQGHGPGMAHGKRGGGGPAGGPSGCGVPVESSSLEGLLKTTGPPAATASGHSLALLATSQGNEGTAQQHPPPPPALARRNLSSSMRASALLGVLGLVVVLLRKGRVSKARLLELLAASLGGLLSSSCCTIQLVLNSVSVGCAGFAVLDRFRPFFLFFTFSSLAYKTAMYDVRLHHKPWRSLSTWIVALVLATSPAVVRRLNRGGSGGLVAGAAGQPPLLLLQYKVVGMKCEACANGLKNALEALDTDVHADVLFEEGVVFVEKKSMAADAALELGIAGVFEERGYTSEKVQQRNCEA